MSDREFGLYVHWPFCQAKCPYCDFNSHVPKTVDDDAWKRALVQEIRRYGEELPGRRLHTIFFGGGTPSLMSVKTVEAIISAAASLWQISDNIEITLEANPNSAEEVHFRDFAAAGVNRASIGVQALDDADLRRLGRLHTAAEALAAVESAQSVFSRVSFDLIYARQDQSLQSWETELAHALSVGTDHLSLYQLTIEPETAFGALYARGRLRGLPNEDLGADLYISTQELTEAAGLPAYEVSNHARAGSEGRHNLIYWQGGDWVGVGPGAHGRFWKDGVRIATKSVRSPEAWLCSPREGEMREIVGKTQVFEERVMMGLRLAEGLPKSVAERLDPGRVTDLCRAGFVTKQRGRLQATRSGTLVLNAVIGQLLA